MATQYRSGVMASVHETAEGLHQAGLMPKRTLREFDAIVPDTRALLPAQEDPAAKLARRHWCPRLASVFWTLTWAPGRRCLRVI